MTAASRTLRETAHAKLNLALHVRERMDDGYHRIETLFAFCEDGDAIEAAPSDGITLDIAGPFAASLAAGDDNLVLRAARALADRCAIATGARLGLTKRLPVASGIGGGSADAAATLRVLARLWGLDPDDPRLAETAASLGADVPACLCSCAAVGLDRGDRLEPMPRHGLGGAPVLLVSPLAPLATAAVYAGWDGLDRGALGDGDAMAIALAGRNDLEPPAKALQPAIADVLALLAGRPDVLLARMSGSGATCFALFEGGPARDATRDAIAEARPGWWVLASALR